MPRYMVFIYRKKQRQSTGLHMVENSGREVTRFYISETNRPRLFNRMQIRITTLPNAIEDVFTKAIYELIIICTEIPFGIQEDVNLKKIKGLSLKSFHSTSQRGK